MKYSKKHFNILILTLFLTLFIVACGQENSPSSSDESSSNGENSNENTAELQVIDVSVPNPEDSHHGAGIKKFGEELERLTDGRLTIEPHYNNELGGEREVIEGMGAGTIDAGLSSTGPLGGFADELLIFDLPYLFEDNEHAYAVFDGEIGEELAQILEEEANVKVIAWMENGWRHNTNSVGPIETPSDLEGMKLRTQESQVQLDIWTTLGADATPMAWPEVFTSLQQGVIDGQDNPLATIYPNRFYEVQDYLNLTGHVYSPLPLMMSKSLFDSFSEEDQQAIMEAGELATPYQREYSQNTEDELLEKLKEEGMEVTEPDLQPFKEAVEPIYDEWKSTIGEDLLDRVMDY